MPRRKGKWKLNHAQNWTMLISLGILTAVCALILYHQSDKSIFTVTLGSADTASSSATVTKSEFQIHVIDVGNADSIFITNQKKNMLIDAGENTDGDKVIAYLRSQGVDKLDYLIATHTDSDHIGGMDDVIDAFDVDTFIMPDMPDNLIPTTKTYKDLLTAIDHKGLTVTYAVPGTSYSLGGASFVILGPSGTFDSANNMSVVCRFTYGQRHFLLMGDAEEEAEDALLKSGADLSADFIKVGHHGSNTSTKKKFLKAVSPRYAAITCGADNDYNHPSPDTLERLKEQGVTYYRSDINGNILVVSDGDSITVTTEK